MKFTFEQPAHSDPSMTTNNYLDIEAIHLSDNGVERHPLRPFLPENARVIFLGSFPPQRKRWSMDFFYPNYINDHWRIEGLVFFNDKDHFVNTKNKTFKLPEIVDFLNQKGIALYDTCTAIRRLKDNASDKFLEVVEATDIKALLGHLPHCRLVVTTGEKATDTIMAHFGIESQLKVGHSLPTGLVNRDDEPIEIYRLPSSSRAYPMSIDRKADFYRKMFTYAGIL